MSVNQIKLSLALPLNSTGEAKVQGAETLLDIAHEAGRQWIADRGLTGGDGQPLPTTRAIDIGIEYSDSDIKLIIRPKARAIEQIVPVDCARSVSSFLATAERLGDKPLSLFKRLAFHAAIAMLPREQAQEALARSREDFLVAKACAICVKEIGDLTQAAIPAAESRMMRAFGSAKP